VELRISGVNLEDNLSETSLFEL